MNYRIKKIEITNTKKHYTRKEIFAKIKLSYASFFFKRKTENIEIFADWSEITNQIISIRSSGTGQYIEDIYGYSFRDNLKIELFKKMYNKTVDTSTNKEGS